MSQIRELWTQRPVFGLWSILPGPAGVAAAAGLDLDFVVFDAQHGAADEQSLAGSCAAAVAAGLAPLVRTRSASFADVGRPLDLGAHGVIVPSVLGVEHAREVVRATRYPPLGTRSNGRLYGGSDQPLCLPMVETAGALSDLAQILALEGLDGVFVGPFDLALSLGGPAAIGGPQVAAAIDTVAATCRTAGTPFGVFATDGAAARRHREAGARIVVVTSDAVALAEAVRGHAGAARER